MREIAYHESARQELGAAVTWLHEHRAAHIAARFLDEVSDAVLQIAELADAWPVSKFDQRVRVRYLRRIRYAIFYVVSPSTITVVAIAHTSRRPGYWLDRLR